MKALVVAASRHGSTEGIAQAIADELRAQDIETDLFDAEAAEYISNLEKYDAVILGSAVYLAHWMAEASRFAEHTRGLASVPLWLFSGPPLDENSHPPSRGMTQLWKPWRASASFASRPTEINAMSFCERLISKVWARLRDFRDWNHRDGLVHCVRYDSAAEGATA